VAVFRLNKMQSLLVESSKRASDLLDEDAEELQRQINEIRAEQKSRMTAVCVAFGLEFGIEEIPEGARFDQGPDGLYTLLWPGEPKYKVKPAPALGEAKALPVPPASTPATAPSRQEIIQEGLGAAEKINALLGKDVTNIADLRAAAEKIGPIPPPTRGNPSGPDLTPDLALAKAFVDAQDDHDEQEPTFAEKHEAALAARAAAASSPAP